MSDYEVIEINYYRKKKNIVCQGQNQSSAFIAVINYLSLNNKIVLEPNWEQVICEEDLLLAIQNAMDEVFMSQRCLVHKDAISGFLQLLKKQDSASLNPCINSISGFAPCPVLKALNILKIPIYHGYVLEDTVSTAARKLRSSSYGALMRMYKSPPSSKDELDGDKKENWEAIANFMESTKCGPNIYGIACIRDRMILEQQKLAILYTDGQFDLIVLHNGIVHILQTNNLSHFADREEERNSVWLMYDVNSNGFLVTDEFNPDNEDDKEEVVKMYVAGLHYQNSLPQQIAEKNSRELIELEEREKEKKLKKEAAAREKRKKSQAHNTFEVSQSSKEIPPAILSETCNISEDLPCDDIQDTLDGPGILSQSQMSSLPDASSVSSQSVVSKMFREFLDKFDYNGRSEKPYFEGEVQLMKERNLYEISFNYNHLIHKFEKLALLIRDDLLSISGDIKDCLVQFLIDHGVEKKLAEKVHYEFFNLPKRYQSFVKFAETNRDKLVEFHEIYQRKLSIFASKFGRRMFRRFLKIIKIKHREGLCWNGKWSANQMMVSSDGKKFLITAEAKDPATQAGVAADLKRLCDIVFTYYTYEAEDVESGQKVSKKYLPHYFKEFKADCGLVPDPNKSPEKFNRFYRWIYAHPALKSPLAVATVIGHFFAVCDSLLESYEFVYSPLQVQPHFEWSVKRLPPPFGRVYNYWSPNYYEPGYWFLLKYLRNFLEHGLRNTEDYPVVPDLMNNSMMVGEFLADYVTSLLKYIVMHLDIHGRFKTAWRNFEESK